MFRRGTIPAWREWDRLASSFYAQHPYPCAIRPKHLRTQRIAANLQRSHRPNYPASANGRRQQGHSPSCPWIRARNAVGCGMIMIALNAKETVNHLVLDLLLLFRQLSRHRSSLCRQKEGRLHCQPDWYWVLHKSRSSEQEEVLDPSRRQSPESPRSARQTGINGKGHPATA